MKTKIAFILVLACAVFAFAGCAQQNQPASSACAESTSSQATAAAPRTLDQIRQSGVLRVGTTGDYKPMAFREESGEYWGFDTELSQDLAHDLGVKIEWVPTTWPALMDDTTACNFDLALCGITITDARKEKALMSDGYFANGKTILVRSADIDRFKSLDDVDKQGVTVMENPGGLNEKFARENLHSASIVIHDDNAEIHDLIAKGEADVMITEIMEAGYYAGLDPNLAAPLINQPFTSGQLGALMPRGSEDLRAYVNDFLKREKDSGRLDQLGDKYIYRSSSTEADDAETPEEDLKVAA